LSATLFVTLRHVQILHVRRGWSCYAKAASGTEHLPGGFTRELLGRNCRQTL